MYNVMEGDSSHILTGSIKSYPPCTGSWFINSLFSSFRTVSHKKYLPVSFQMKQDNKCKRLSVKPNPLIF